MAVLLTGGTGKTSTHIVPLLHSAQIPFLLASRRGPAASAPGTSAIKFDWFDASTFPLPFAHRFPSGERISAIYLVAPVGGDPAPPMNAFIDYAVKQQGVRRFVLLAGSSAVPGGPYHGMVWRHLLDLGVEWCVLLPTWFMENFAEWGHRFTIRDEGKIYTACGDGKIPFISAVDIAAVAFGALTDEKSHDTEYLVLGPELLTMDQIAEKLSSCLGREVVHVRLSGEEITKRLMSNGLPEENARFLAYLEVKAASGSEDRMNDAVERVTGRPPLTFNEFAQRNKAAWQ